MTETAKPKPSNLTIRLATAAVVCPVIIWSLFWGPHWGWASFVLVLAMGVAAQELFAMVLPGAKLLQAWGIASTLFIGALSYAEITGYNPTGVPMHLGFVLFIVGTLLVSLSKPLPSEAAGVRMAWLLAGPLYVGVTTSSLASLHALKWGGSWVILSMMLAWFSDTGAYFAGRFLGGKIFGGARMSPNISPNKTWEGAVGGVAGSTVGVLLAHYWYLQALPLVDGLLLAWVAGPLGIFGDLVESLIKRSTGSKDSGWIVPGHGGMIDRIDALMFTATATLIYARYIH